MASPGTTAAALVGGVAHVLVEDTSPAALAGALAWALRRDATGLVLLADPDPALGVLARQGSYLSLPVEVREVRGPGSAPVDPAPLPEVLPGAASDDLLDPMRLEGLEIVVEQGIVRGEVLGLEVARVVVWPEELGGDGALHLEAGVGRFDRDAAAAVHQGESPSAALARAVETVRRHRHPGAPTHPLSLLARERWLRAALVADPASIGATELVPVETTVERDNVRDPSPAAALGHDGSGPLVVVCGIGADLDLVPVAADTRALHSPGARLVLAVPRRDVLPITEQLAALVAGPEGAPPAEVVAVPEPWGAAVGTP